MGNFILGFITGGVITILIMCIVIVGKESENR